MNQMQIIIHVYGIISKKNLEAIIGENKVEYTESNLYNLGLL